MLYITIKYYYYNIKTTFKNKSIIKNELARISTNYFTIQITETKDWTPVLKTCTSKSTACALGCVAFFPS